MAERGTIIEGKYEVLKLIGKGGMSKVYLAMDKNLNKQWAIKEIERKAYDKNNEVVVASAMAEANMMKKLDYPSLPRIVDIIEKENVIYVVMDYIEGETLSSVLSKEGAQPQEVVIEWAKELCRVLDYLHTQNPPIIYRDMKPANIMLQPNGNIKLIDFGIAREYKEQNLADTVSLGTKGYAAPEQFGGKGQTDARTDVYCLGVTLYHLLTGQNPCEPPYEIYPIRYWNPQLSSGLEAIIQKCTQLNPEDRYQSCAELLYALDHYDEMDEGYRKKQKNKLKVFFITAGSAVFFLIAGCVCTGMRVHVNNSDYDNNIKQAELSATDEEKIDYYAKAIDILPGNSEAYFGIIEAFKDDAVFSLEEEELFKKKINSNLTVLQQNSDYGDLAFEIGKLYWYYYDYGKTENSDNQITRMKSAIQWFEAACTYGGEDSSYYTMAEMYRDIGQFNRDITLNVQEASDKGTYLPYWENITKLVATVSESQDENEIVNLEVYKLAMNAVETYARKFKADDVAQEDMKALLEQVKAGTEQVDTTTDKTEEMKNDILKRLQDAEAAVGKCICKRYGGESIMNAGTLQLISIIAFSLAGVLTLISIYLFLKMDVRGIIDDLSGKSAERQIMAMREENNRQKNPLSKRSAKSSETRKSSLMERTTVELKNEEKTEVLPKKDEEKTALLREEATMPLQMVEEETTALEETTTVLQEDETVVLTENAGNTDKRYELVLNEIIIHTQEII